MVGKDDFSGRYIGEGSVAGLWMANCFVVVSFSLFDILF